MTQQEIYCGLVITNRGLEQEVVWRKTKRGDVTRVDFSGPARVVVYAPTEYAAAHTAHRAGLRAVKKRGKQLVGILGGWQKLASYQFKHPSDLK